MIRGTWQWGPQKRTLTSNTIAVPFRCDINNIAFALGLSERARAQMESAGRFELGDLRVRTKAVHVTPNQLSSG